MGFRRRVKTTGKVEIPEGTRKEAEFLYLHKITSLIRNPKQEVLLIMDVFRGQITDDVTNRLKENNIQVVLVPNNMTHLFQPLDLTVSKHCKLFLKNRFSEWYSQQIENQLAVGKKIEHIDIKFKLTTIKPLHLNG